MGRRLAATLLFEFQKRFAVGAEFLRPTLGARANLTWFGHERSSKLWVYLKFKGHCTLPISGFVSSLFYTIEGQLLKGSYVGF
jgi:hypothetical protein